MKVSGFVLRFVPWLAATVVFFLVVVVLLRILPGVQQVELDLEIDHPDHLRVYHSPSRVFREESAAALQPIPLQRAKVRVLLTGSFASYLRFDTGGQPGRTKIYGIRVLSYFHAPLQLGPKEIGERFVASPDATLTVHGEYAEVLSRGQDPYIFSPARLLPKMPLTAAAVALGFALLVLILIQQRLFPGECSDGGGKPLPSPERFQALDGLRGLAAMMVIADHTWGWFRGVGASGVWIFFALSGFLLARPFIEQPRLVLSFSYMAGYLRRRFMRILPMYYAYIFVVYLVAGRLNLALAHGLFLQGDGHLWAVPQEILFYLLWPVVVLLAVGLARWKAVFPLVLVVLVVLWNRSVDISIIWLLGMDHVRLPLFFGVFLSGVVCSYAYSWLANLADRQGAVRILLGQVSALLIPLILIFFLLFSTGHLLGQKVVLSQKYFGIYGGLAGLLVLATVMARNTLVERFLVLAPLRELGKVGLSLYLLHPLVKNLIDTASTMYLGGKIKNLPLFLATLVLSALLAHYTFRHIEQPGFLERSPRSEPNTGVGSATR